jgi:hypothetical protein
MADRWNGLEHRWGERVRVNIPVHVAAEDLTHTQGWMKNLSLSGALMKADVDLRLHSLIEVSIPLAPTAPGSAVIIAHVSRKQKDAVGLEWCRFGSTVVKDLLRSPYGRDR